MSQHSAEGGRAPERGDDTKDSAGPAGRGAGDVIGVPGPPAPFEPFPLDSTERIYDSPWVGLRRDMLRLDNGELQEHHVVEVGDAVSIVPFRTDGRLVMVGQHRHTHGHTHWEVPAGRIDAGEAPIECAARELREETGYEAGRLVPLPGYYTCNGISNHWIHPFAALDCELRHEQQLDPSERMIVETFAPDEVEAMLRAGTLHDGLSLIALFYSRLLLP